MSSFKKSLESMNIEEKTVLNNTVSEPTVLLSEDTSEFVKYEGSNVYDWYEQYQDDDFSIVDDFKNINISDKQVNITQEENSQIVPFQLNRFFDGVDLIDMSFQIHYVNANGDDGRSTPINVMYNDTKIRFYWLIDNKVTAISGNISLEITAFGTNEKGLPYTWKTKPCREKINILEALSGNGMIEPSDDWYTIFVNKMNALVSEAKSYADAAEASANRISEENITNNVINKIQETHYDKISIDEKIKNLNDTITNLDSLSSLKVEYDTESGDLTFKDDDTFLTKVSINSLSNLNVTYEVLDGKGVLKFLNGTSEIVSVQLSSINPSDEWTLALKNAIQNSINASTKVVQDDLNSYKTENNNRISDVENQIENIPETYGKQEIDNLLSQKAPNTELSSLKSNVAIVESTANTNKEGLGTLSAKLSELEKIVGDIDTTPSVRYKATYDSEFRWTLWEVEGENETAVSSFIISGGSGGPTTSTTVKIDRITPSPLIITKQDKAVIEYTFSSVDASWDDTGEGTATWKVGNSIVATSIALQGKNSFDLSKYVSVGTQKITLSITDAAGTISVKTWTIQIIDVRIESTFNDQLNYPLEPVSFTYTPYGSIEKTVHFKLDNRELEAVKTTSSGLPMSYTIPVQEHGSHLLETYITAEINNSIIETNHIFKDILFYNESSNVPVIGCTTQNLTLKQYDTYNIVYVVYDPNTENPTITLSVDGDVISTQIIDSHVQTWQFKSDSIGNHILTITCRDTVKTINVNVEKLDIDIEPVTANLVFDFNPSGKNNNDENRLWSDRGITMSVSDNFDWVNGGYQIDKNGDQYFCVKSGTTATINYNLFSDDARKNGKEFKIVFKTENVRKSNATFLNCQSGDTIPIGLQMNVHEVYIKSSAKSLYIPYSEEDIIEFEFNINKDTDIPIVLTYEDGTPYRPMSYTSDYSFTQTSPVPIVIGSSDCDVLIYRMKAYNTSLSSRAILSNFIADARNASEMINRYTRNQIYNENNQLTPESVAAARPDLKIIKLECPHFTNDKKDFVKNTSVECIHVNGDPKLDNWKATNCYHSGQGTTSNEYGAASRNMDILMCFDGKYKNKRIPFDENYKTILTLGDGTTYDDGTGKVSLTRNSVPNNYFNIKVNVASSENANNSLLQKRFNDYLPYQSLAQKNNPNVKNTMEFVNCVIFLKENDPDLSTHREFDDTEWHFYSLGNIGDSKKTDNTRVVDVNDPKEFVVEIMDNTLPNSTFSNTPEALEALDADMFDEEGTYGFRYEMDDITPEQQQANMKTWRDFYRFVVSSSDGEFVKNLGEWFILDSALYFYLFTERYTMIDNRAKNTFWHYMKCDDGKYRFEFWDYDNDSALGINNSGELTMSYGKEDIDYRTDGNPGSGYIFNAAESLFFRRIRNLLKDQLSSTFVKLESTNCWSADNLINQFDNWQNQFSEELWRLDYERKYERTYRDGNTRFLETMMNGRKKYQRRQFERDQEKYMATKYFGTVATADQIMFRCNTPVDAVVKPDYTLHLTPYSDMYLSVMFGATYRKQIRAKAGQEYDIECPFETMDDTAVLIYCASRIQSIGDISTCYIHDNDFSKAEKLQILIVGNNTEGYSNVFLTNLVIGNNGLLERLDIRNTPNLVSSLNLSGCPNLEELYAEHSGLTGVTFANGGKIKIAHIPSISSLTIKNLSYITDMQIESFNNLHHLIIENTPKIDSYNYVNSASQLTNLRLIGIDWGTDEGITDTSILDRLIKIAGIDSNGYNTPISILNGLFYSPVVKQRLLAEYIKAWPDLKISYETLITQFTVTFQNYDGTVLDIQYVDIGSNAVDPITREENPIDIPTKPSSVSTDYTFSRWDLSLDAVFSNRTITAEYSESVREYNVKYVSKDFVLLEKRAPYGSYVEYTGEIPSYTDEETAFVYHIFKYWDKSGFVDGDKTINAVYDRFEYREGCFDGLELSEMTPVQIYALTKRGMATEEAGIVNVKDSLVINMGNDYSYSDVEENEIINSPITFTGTNYQDTGIKLLETDRNWTLAIDYKFDEGNKSNSVLVQCYQGDGSNGFKLNYSSVPKITWGTSSLDAAAVGKRDMIVLRHIAGEQKIHIYRGNLPSDTVDYSTLNSNKIPTASSTLVFGCAKADDGFFENYAKGIIYWCKIWYADLGDIACKKMASWTHERLEFELYGFRKYYLSDNSGQRSSMSFLGTHLLSNNMPLGNTPNNTGGWAKTSLNLFLNTRFYEAMPVEWKQIIKQVKVPSTIGNKSHETSTSNCYITIPAVVSVSSIYDYEPYNAEGSIVPYIVSNSTRLRKHENGVADEYWTRSPSIQYSTYFIYVTADGSVNEFAYTYNEKGILLELSI